MRYFAYGTNVNPAVLARKKLDFVERQSAVLRDHALRFDKQSLRALLPANIGFANIAPSPGDQVEGVVYEMADAQLARLDELERCPEHYERIEVTVETSAGPLTAHSYRAQPDKTAAGLIPSRNYVNHIIAAGAMLTPAYRQWLERLETYAGACAACHRVQDVLFHKESEQMYVLCVPCLEAKRMWGETLGRPFTVLDTEAVIMHLRRTGQSYDSVGALIVDAIERGLIEQG